VVQVRRRQLKRFLFPTSPHLQLSKTSTEVNPHKCCWGLIFVAPMTSSLSRNVSDGVSVTAYKSVNIS
jgi:hypothetical protein